jgi:alginate O-acetyltransferase complex protein AlgI
VNFTNLSFFVFVAAVVALVWFAPNGRSRRIILLIASYLFYASWSPLYLLLLILIGVVAQQMGQRAIAAEPAARTRTAYLGVAILLALLMLFRSAFVLDPIRNAWVGATGFGMADAVPLGLSFYVFEAISYLIEVGKGREKAYRFWEFQLFIGFFPHLLAGPIMKAKELIPQLGLSGKDTNWTDALWRIASGLFMKVVLADQLAVKLDPWFVAPPGTLHASDVAVVGFGFAAQMYCDFAGYTSIAIGVGLLCGVKLIENFNAPFLATSPADFWNRWHISLSRWIRDYVFLAFVGTRRTITRFCGAAMLAMALCGVWHAVTLKFLVWGLFHGAAIAGYHLYRHFFSKVVATRVSLTPNVRRVLAIAGWATTLLVLFPGWILFRAPDLRAAASIFAGLSQLGGRAVPGNVYLHVGLLMMALVLIPFLRPRAIAFVRSFEQSRPARVAVDLGIGLGFAATLIVTMLYLGTSGSFVYFQF